MESDLDLNTNWRTQRLKELRTEVVVESIEMILTMKPRKMKDLEELVGDFHLQYEQICKQLSNSVESLSTIGQLVEKAGWQRCLLCPRERRDYLWSWKNVKGI